MNIPEAIRKALIKALDREANRLLEEAMNMLPSVSYAPFTEYGKSPVTANSIVEGSVVYPVEDPTRLIEERKPDANQ